ncbi:MAG: hypothetical protein J6B56_03825 [Clostridia bacterium]|nr:hypothetical protein [Clostridia bacterium]
MKTKKKKKIVFVCTGNTCRSPMAEIVFRRLVNEMGLTTLKICSAGLQVAPKSKINEKSAQTLIDKGFEVGTFKPKQIDEKLLVESLAIVCMTDVQRDLLMEMRWQAMKAAGEEEIENNVYSFSELAGYEILDPYGREIDCYHYVFELIAGGMSAIMEKLLPMGIREKYIPKKRASSPNEKTTKKRTKKKTDVNA